MRNPMTHEALFAAAPSVFASRPRHTLTDTYGFIPTSELMGALAKQNWFPVQASQKKSRAADRRVFAKHLVRFGNPDVPAIRSSRGDLMHPEIVLVNSHDGSSSWQLMAGLFRLVCSNGLVVADSMFERTVLRHVPASLVLVQEAATKIIDVTPRIAERVDAMSQRMLEPEERLMIAEKALAIKFGTHAPITPAQALFVRRPEDLGNDLWSTINVLQENLVMGGLEGAAATGRRVTTRAVRDINMNLWINRGLWEMAEAV